MNNAVASGENLYFRNCRSLPICDAKIESIEHILFRCKWTISVWESSIFQEPIVEQDITSVIWWSSNLLDTQGSSKEGLWLFSNIFVECYSHMEA